LETYILPALPQALAQRGTGLANLVGDISMTNMNGDNGQCATVIDPLSFEGSPKAWFEMSLADAQTAKLKFLGTPVEDTPWQLTKSADQ
jgi:hypothetical protein